MRRPGASTSDLLFGLLFPVFGVPLFLGVAAFALLEVRLSRLSATFRGMGPAGEALARRGLAPRRADRLYHLGFEHRPLLAQTRSRWRRRLLEVRCSDRERAEAAVRQAYRRVDLAEPEIRWCESPLALLTVASAADGGDDVAVDVCRKPLLVTGGLLPPPTSSLEHLIHEAIGLHDGIGDDSGAARVAGQLTAAFPERSWNALAPAWTAARVERLVAQTRDAAPGTVEARIDSPLLPWELTATLAKADFLFAAGPLAAPSARSTEDFRFLATLAAQCGGMILRSRLALLCERHLSLSLDEDGELHGVDSPAVSWTDGYGVWAWHGDPFSKRLGDRRTALDAAAAIAEPNAELRRELLESVGPERLLEDLDATLIDRDPTGALWWIAVPGDETLALLEVANATTERDGSRRRYFLRVPPTVVRARAAVAWTFGLDEHEWNPDVAS